MQETYFMTDMAQWDCVGDGNAPFVFLLEDNIRRILVDSNAKTFKLILDDSFVSEWLVDIEDDEDQMARLGYSDNLATSTFAILGPLDNSGQIEHLNRSAINLNLTRDGG